MPVVPLAYLDFETIKGPLVHHAWLAEGPSDPRETLARRQIRFTRGTRTIESTRVRHLQEHLPHLAEELG